MNTHMRTYTMSVFMSVLLLPHFLYCRDTDLELNRRVELVKAEKSDIQAQFNQCQSELDNLIKTERRLKEKYIYSCVITVYTYIL